MTGPLPSCSDGDARTSILDFVASVTTPEANAFTVFICTGGGRDFVRVVGEEMYGIRRERVIGTGPTLEYRDGDLYRTTGVERPIDDAVREFAYDGGAEQALAEATRRGWTVASMKDDFATIF